MKQLREVLRSKLEVLIQRLVREKDIFRKSNSNGIALSKDEELLAEHAAKIEEQPEEQIQQKGFIKNIVQKLLVGYKRLAEFSLPVK